MATAARRHTARSITLVFTACVEQRASVRGRTAGARTVPCAAGRLAWVAAALTAWGGGRGEQAIYGRALGWWCTRCCAPAGGPAPAGGRGSPWARGAVECNAARRARVPTQGPSLRVRQPATGAGCTCTSHAFLKLAGKGGFGRGRTCSKRSSARQRGAGRCAGARPAAGCKAWGNGRAQSAAGSWCTNRWKRGGVIYGRTA